MFLHFCFYFFLKEQNNIPDYLYLDDLYFLVKNDDEDNINIFIEAHIQWWEL